MIAIIVKERRPTLISELKRVENVLFPFFCISSTSIGIITEVILPSK
jgi:hypothetical protein